MIQPLPRRLLVALCAVLSAASLQAEQVNIATSSNPVKKIVIPATSGSALIATAHELKDFLNRMKSGTSTFVVETFSTTAGPNAGTIVLGTAADLNLTTQLDDPATPAYKEKDHFLLASGSFSGTAGTHIVIAGVTELAVSHGVYDLLERMGCSWYMPTAAWEVIPNASATVRWTTPATASSTQTVTMGTKSISLRIYHDEQPDYKMRWLTIAFTGTGTTGGNNAKEWLQQNLEWLAWNKRNRQSPTLKINNTHSYANIITWAKSQTLPPNDPVNGRWKQEYYAKVSVSSTQRGDPSLGANEKSLVQLCASNTAVVQLCKDYAVWWFSQTANAGEVSISMEPNDGTRYWCTCTSSSGAPNGCAVLKWGGVEDGDPSNDDYFVTDQPVHLANEVAKAIPAGKFVGMLAYAKHSGWPSLELEPNVYVSIVNGYLSYGMTMPLLMDKWASKRGVGDEKNLGVYDYYSLFGVDRGMPNSCRATDLTYLTNNLAAWNNGPGKADLYTGESSYSMGALGLGHYITHKLLWNSTADVAALRKDFLVKCFGAEGTPIYSSMDNFFRRIDRGNKNVVSTDLIGRLFRYLDDAYGQTSDPKVIARLNALSTWVKYCELNLNFKNTDPASRQPLAQDILEFGWITRSTSMVDSLALWKSPISLGNNDDEPAKDFFDWPLNTVWWYDYGLGSPDYAPGTLELTSSMPGPDATIGVGGIPERHPWKISGTIPDGVLTDSEILAIVDAGIVANPLLPEEPRVYSHDLIPGGLSNMSLGRGGFGSTRTKKIGLYLRTGSTGAFPTSLLMKTGFSQNKGNIPYTLYDKDGISELQTGTLAYGTGTWSGINFWNEDASSIYIMDMDDFNAGTQYTWNAGEKISMMARSDWPYSSSGGQKRYFYVPKGAQSIIFYSTTLSACSFKSASGTSIAVAAVSSGSNVIIPINDTLDEQVWCIQNLHTNNFFFQNIPGVLATQADELLLPKEAFGELIPSGGSAIVTRGTNVKTNGTNAFYLRGDGLGMLPTLSISGTLTGTNTGTSKWRLLSENGQVEYVSGTFVRTNMPQTFTIPINSGSGIVPTSTTDTFLLIYDDNKTVSSVTWSATSKVTVAANDTYKHWQVGGASRRYFFVPKGTKEVVYQARSMVASTVYAASGTLKYNQPSSNQPVSTQIIVNPGEDNQFWYFGVFGASDFYFTSIPGYLSLRPDEHLIPKWTTMSY